MGSRDFGKLEFMNCLGTIVTKSDSLGDWAITIGFITNSVNYPSCSLGPLRTAGRVAICHKNTANMIGTFTGILGKAGVNIDAIANKSRGDFAYSLIDTDNPIPAEVVAALEASDAVIRVRVVK